MIPTYSGKDINFVVGKIVEFYEDPQSYEEEEFNAAVKKLNKVDTPEKIIKFFISESWDVYSVDDFLREISKGKRVSQGLIVELFGWAHLWENRFDT